ncbi:MAG: N-6 DNA methylase, partial [Aeriscardovia sp.]|nr:N-6 DNA methylase [Aeriscardovia sp.]
MDFQKAIDKRTKWYEDMQKEKEVVSYILSKCGSSMYWDDWVKNISDSVKNMINEINKLIYIPAIELKFKEFKDNLSKTLHKYLTKEDAINLIAQFIVTRPVFSVLFPSSDFDSNPISRGFDNEIKWMFSRFKAAAYSACDKELEELMFPMEQAAKAVAEDPAARKRLVKNFYEKFYQKVFPKETDVNTPEPVVDFMIKETDRLLEKNFEKRLQDEGIQILDPFCGTGTFVARLLDKDLGIIDDEHVKEKYTKEIWANEIMPTAYYISTLNVEDAMKQRTGEAISFPGAVLTDTFRISEAKGMLDASLFSGNSDRENSEEDRKISVIISNPPYRVKLGNANENNGHACYEYDSYVRAFWWASNRLKGKGIVAFITNGRWLRSNKGADIRSSFAKEFNDIYVYNLRGNARFHDPKEGGNIFDIQAPVAITFLVKNPESDHKGQIHYISTPDFLTKEEKLELLKEAKEKEPEWENLLTDGFGDWFDKRDASLYSLIPTGLKRGSTKIPGIFNIWSAGVKTGSNSWDYSFSKENLLQKKVETFEYALNEGLGWCNEKPDPSYIRTALWRPFIRKYLYFDRPIYASPQPSLNSLFPESDSFNLEICVPGVGPHSFSCLMADMLPDLNLLSRGTQCFPLYRYEKDSFGLEGYERKSAITDLALEMFREVYGDTLNSDPDKAKEQIFYYIYGILHSKEYRENYQDNLGKDLSRIPFSSHFKEFEKAGRELATFHVRYEKAPKYEGIEQEGEPEGEIGKMRLDKDRGVLTVNKSLSFKNIPKEAFEYVVNGRSPLAWVVDQYKVKTDKDWGIISDPNDSPISDIDYVADLIPRLVTVSLKTQEIVNSLPSIDRITSMDSVIEKIWEIEKSPEEAIETSKALSRLTLYTEMA